MTKQKEKNPPRLLSIERIKKLLQSQAHKARVQERQLLFLNEKYQQAKKEFREKYDISYKGLFFPKDIEGSPFPNEKIIPMIEISPYNSKWFSRKTEKEQMAIQDDAWEVVDKFKKQLPYSVKSFYWVWNDFLYSSFLIPSGRSLMLPVHPKSIVDPRYPFYSEEKKILSLAERKQVLEFTDKQSEKRFAEALEKHPGHQYSKSFEEMKIKSYEDLLKISDWLCRNIKGFSLIAREGIGWEEGSGGRHDVAYKYRDILTGEIKYTAKDKAKRKYRTNEEGREVGIVPVVRQVKLFRDMLDRNGKIPLSSVLEYRMISRVLANHFAIGKEYWNLLLGREEKTEEGTWAKIKVKEIISLYAPIVRKRAEYLEEIPKMEEWARKTYERMQEEIGAQV